MARLEAVVVSYKTGPVLGECLTSLLAEPSITRIWLVDNGNAPQTIDELQALAAREPRLQVLSGHGNIGFSRGCNLGANRCTAPFLLFLNPDAQVQKGTVGALIKALDPAPEFSIAGARLLDKNGKEQRGARRGRLTPWSALVAMSGLSKLENLHPAFSDMHWERRPLPDTPQKVFAVSGACLMMRNKDYHALGGFDERYFLHVEDLDLCRRARLEGGHVLFVPDALVVHAGSTSKAARLAVDWHKAVGLCRYFNKFANTRAQKFAALVIAGPIMGAVMARSVLITVRNALPF